MKKFLMIFVLLLSTILFANGQINENVRLSKKTSLTFRDVNLRLETVSDFLSQDSIAHFILGEKVYVRLLALQNGKDAFSLKRENQFLRFKPILLRNGVELPFLPSVADNIKAAQKEEVENIRGGGISIRLQPNVETKIAILNLGDWYGQLASGVYQLTIVFVVENDVIKSDLTVFEVKSLTQESLILSNNFSVAVKSAKESVQNKDTKTLRLGLQSQFFEVKTECVKALVELEGEEILETLINKLRSSQVPQRNTEMNGKRREFTLVLIAGIEKITGLKLSFTENPKVKELNRIIKESSRWLASRTGIEFDESKVKEIKVSDEVLDNF